MKNTAIKSMLADFTATKQNRQRVIAITRNGTTLYFAGIQGFVADKDEATRFDANRIPHDILRKHPGAKAALA